MRTTLMTQRRMMRNAVGHRSVPTAAFVLLLVVAQAASTTGCGRFGAKEKTDGAGQSVQSAPAGPLDADPVGFVRDPVALESRAVPAETLLLSYDGKGRLRARTSKGTSMLLKAGAAPELEWVVTVSESAELGGSANLVRASRDRAWRFGDGKATYFHRAGESAPWRAFEADVDGTWRPLAVEQDGVVVAAGSEVRSAWFDGKGIATRAFRWPQGKDTPMAAGFLQGLDLVWVFGGTHFYVVNMATGKWQTASFPARDPKWGDIRSMALRPDPKAPLALTKPAAFAVFGSKGTFHTGSK